MGAKPSPGVWRVMPCSVYHFFRTGVPLHTNLLGVFGNSQLKGVIDDGEVIVSC